MSNISFRIETEGENIRSNQKVIKLLIENNGLEKVRILSINPIVPQGVVIEEKKDSFQESAKEKHSDLCGELTDILGIQISTESEEYREQIKQMQAEMIHNFVKEIPSLMLKFYMSFFKRSLIKSHIKSLGSKLDAMEFTIQSLDDAKWAYDKWFGHLGDDSYGKKLYEGKLKQLEDLENKIGDVNSSWLALVEPNSFYTRSYVVKFKNDMFSQKIFNIAINGKYQEDNTDGEFRGTASLPVTVSPQSFALTVVAVSASILGTILKYTLANPVYDSLGSYFFLMIQQLVTSPGISAIIIALIFFNIYEHTDFGKRINMSLNWQIALLIGIISGIMGNRLVEAIKIFVGFK